MTKLLSELASYGVEWLLLFVPLAVGLAVTALLVATGEPGAGGNGLQRLIHRAGTSLERVTHLPAWCAGGLLVGILALTIAFIGFVWDVTWHIDRGRDAFLFTPAHMCILVGLGLIAGAAVVSILLATVLEADVGRRVRHIRIPHGALALLVLGAGALVGFPLDDLWHRNYGIDVTMWGPTHLLMISGASFAPIAMWLLLTEAGPGAGRPRFVRALRGGMAAMVLIGLSTFQLEFDLGVPQFQQLYHPVLIAAAAGIALVAVRAALGPGRAVAATFGFIAIRAALAGLVGPVLGDTLPRFPLYVGAALAVELAFWLGRRLRPFQTALAAGLAVGTVGLAAEWGWMQAWGRHPWGASLWPGILVATAIAVPAAIIGLAIGRVVSFRPLAVPRTALAASGLALVALLAVPHPRHVDPVRAEVITRPAGAGAVAVQITLDPADAARDADWFEVLSWQGGGSKFTPLVSLGGGRFRTRGAVPVTGHWKSVIRLARHDLVMAVPVYFPADPELGLAGIPAVARQDTTFLRDTDLLMREAHAGPSWPAAVAYGSILGVAVIWMTALVAGFAAVHRGTSRAVPGRPIRRPRIDSPASRAEAGIA